MIRDFNDFDDGASFAAELCIVGAGAAGIALAREFIGTRHEVLVLESGGLNPEATSQLLFNSEIAGLPHNSIHSGRARILGGTTTLWGGQALRFGGFDFAERDWVPNSGWPISRQQLDPYYERAERILRLGKHLSYEELCAQFRMVAPDFNTDKLYMECSQWSPKPNFGTAYRYELRHALNIDILLHANAISIVTNTTAHSIDHIEFKTLGGKQGFARARFFIMCCGGIETARVLLASNGVEPYGVGNCHDLVGRYFQEHVHLEYGTVLTNNRRNLQNMFESFFVGGLKYAPLITLSEEVQRENKLLSIHGTVIFEQTPDSAISAMKKLFRAIIGRSVSDVRELQRLIAITLANPDEFLSLAYRLHIQKRGGTPKHGPILFGAQCEMAPNPNSRVTLSDARDALGIPKARLAWELGDLERRTALTYVKILANEFGRLDLGVFDTTQVDVFEDTDAWVQRAHDSAHHMGTTRMHENPRFGVVDSECKVHGIDNLYIGSSSVFPTSARSNPTLTILALCIRMADRLKQLL